MQGTAIDIVDVNDLQECVDACNDRSDCLMAFQDSPANSDCILFTTVEVFAPGSGTGTIASKVDSAPCGPPPATCVSGGNTNFYLQASNGQPDINGLFVQFEPYGNHFSAMIESFSTDAQQFYLDCSGALFTADKNLKFITRGGKDYVYFFSNLKQAKDLPSAPTDPAWEVVKCKANPDSTLYCTIAGGDIFSTYADDRQRLAISNEPQLSPNNRVTLNIVASNILP